MAPWIIPPTHSGVISLKALVFSPLVASSSARPRGTASTKITYLVFSKDVFAQSEQTESSYEPLSSCAVVSRPQAWIRVSSDSNSGPAIEACFVFSLNESQAQVGFVENCFLVNIRHQFI